MSTFFPSKAGRKVGPFEDENDSETRMILNSLSTAQSSIPSILSKESPYSNSHSPHNTAQTFLSNLYSQSGVSAILNQRGAYGQRGATPPTGAFTPSSALQHSPNSRSLLQSGLQSSSLQLQQHQQQQAVAAAAAAGNLNQANSLAQGLRSLSISSSINPSAAASTGSGGASGGGGGVVPSSAAVALAAATGGLLSAQQHHSHNHLSALNNSSGPTAVSISAAATGVLGGASSSISGGGASGLSSLANQSNLLTGGGGGGGGSNKPSHQLNRGVASAAAVSGTSTGMPSLASSNFSQIGLSSVGNSNSLSSFSSFYPQQQQQQQSSSTAPLQPPPPSLQSQSLLLQQQQAAVAAAAAAAQSSSSSSQPQSQSNALPSSSVVPLSQHQQLLSSLPNAVVSGQHSLPSSTLSSRAPHPSTAPHQQPQLDPNEFPHLGVIGRTGIGGINNPSAPSNATATNSLISSAANNLSVAPTSASSTTNNSNLTSGGGTTTADSLEAAPSGGQSSLTNYTDVMNKTGMSGGDHHHHQGHGGSGGGGEFQIHKEDFPALPGPQNPHVMQHPPSDPSIKHLISSSMSSGMPGVAGGTSGALGGMNVNSMTAQGVMAGTFGSGGAAGGSSMTGQMVPGGSGGGGGSGKFPGDRSVASQVKQRGIQTSPDGTISNIPQSMILDQFGISGILSYIRHAEYSPASGLLCPGVDLTTLGMNLNATEPLFSKFQSPWAETPCRPHDIDYHVPPEYLTNTVIKNKLLPFDPSKYSEELLFFVFYMCCGDMWQIAAAAELYHRDWRFHKEERVWITRPEGMRPINKTATSETGIYFFWDVGSWTKVAKDFVVEYSKLEERPLYHSSSTPQLGMSQSQSAIAGAPVTPQTGPSIPGSGVAQHFTH